MVIYVTNAEAFGLEKCESAANNAIFPSSGQRLTKALFSSQFHLHGLYYHENLNEINTSSNVP